MILTRSFLAACAVLFASTFARAQGIADFASADLVLGQTLFTTNASPNPAVPASLSAPEGVAIDPVSGKIFVADTKNNRVLRYASQSALTNGATPELVFGQVNFSENAANQGRDFAVYGQTSLSSPRDVFVDKAGRLWIADSGNNRVLLFENAANLYNIPAYADRVLGQPDFFTATAAPTQTKLATPTGLCIDPAGVLWVADTGSHRVLAFKDAASLPNGAPADRVLGQVDFTSNVAATTQYNLFNPMGVAADATHVWVADTSNYRVLMFTNFPTINGPNASLVLGQTNYNSGVALPPSDSSFNMPTAVALAGSSLWVADSGNNRALRFDGAADLAPGSPASGILGQATYVTASAGLSAQRISLYANTVTRDASHLAIDASGDLWLADSLNNRVLRFTYATPTPTPTPVPVAAPPTATLRGKKTISTSNATFTLRGTAASSTGIRRVSYNLNSQGYIKAKGTTKWSAKIRLNYGRNKVVINSVAKDGQVSAPIKVTIYRR